MEVRKRWDFQGILKCAVSPAGHFSAQIQFFSLIFEKNQRAFYFFLLSGASSR